MPDLERTAAPRPPEPSVAGTGVSPELALLCRIGPRLCALTLEHVAETLRPLPLETLPGMPPFLLGVCILRGRSVPVIDAAALLGIEESPPPQRLVALRVEGRAVALAVSAVVGLRSLAALELRELPPLLQGAGTGVVATLGELDGALLWVLGGGHWVPESLWTRLEPTVR